MCFCFCVRMCVWAWCKIKSINNALQSKCQTNANICFGPLEEGMGGFFSGLF